MILEALIGLLLAFVLPSIAIALIAIFSGVFVSAGAGVVTAAEKAKEAWRERKGQRPEEPLFKPTAVVSPIPAVSSDTDSGKIAA